MSKVSAVGFPEEGKVRVKFYYKYELANLYGISLNTMATYIKSFEPEFMKLGYKRSQKVLNPLQVKRLFELIGEP